MPSSERAFSVVSVKKFLERPDLQDTPAGLSILRDLRSQLLAQTANARGPLHIEDARRLLNLPVAAKSLNISCQCDALTPDGDFIGMIIYTRQNKSEWTVNGIHCKAGYIVIKRAENIKGRPHDTIHQRLYETVFKEDMHQADLLASGFAVKKGGNWHFNSATYNCKYGGHRTLPDEEQELIKKSVLRRFPVNGSGGLHEHKIYRLADLTEWMAVIPDEPTPDQPVHYDLKLADALCSLIELSRAYKKANPSSPSELDSGPESEDPYTG